MYAVIETLVNEPDVTISETCDVLEVSRSAYYSWKESAPTKFEDSDLRLLPLVRMVFRQHKRRYGARRIAKELQSLGHTCSPRRIAKLLKIQGLKAIQPKSFKPRTTESRHRLGYNPNLLLVSDGITGLHQLIVGDITYIPIQGGTFSYLAMLMDRYSRRLVGWQLGTDMTDGLVLAALRMYISSSSLPQGLIHHTDRGGQYASVQYRAVLRRAGMRQSMSRAANCYDNAFMESCFGTLKTELEMTEYENHRAASRSITEYLNYYNAQRRHSSLGYLTPVQFEELQASPK